MMKLLLTFVFVLCSLACYADNHMEECSANGICESTFIIHDKEKCCGENATACEVFVDTENLTCEQYCQNHNTVCLASWNEVGDTCVRDGNNTNCLDDRDDQICLCTKPVATPTPRPTAPPTPAPTPEVCDICPEHDRQAKCYPCKGEVSELRLQYLGNKEGYFYATQKDYYGGYIEIAHKEYLKKFDFIEMWGSNYYYTFGDKISLSINNCVDQYIYTDCDHKIAVGTRIGDQLVIDGESLDYYSYCKGGLDHPDCDCGNEKRCPNKHYGGNDCY